jgi:hypothetical protein
MARRPPCDQLNSASGNRAARRSPHLPRSTDHKKCADRKQMLHHSTRRFSRQRGRIEKRHILTDAFAVSRTRPAHLIRYARSREPYELSECAFALVCARPGSGRWHRPVIVRDKSGGRTGLTLTDYQLSGVRSPAQVRHGDGLVCWC